MGKWAGKWKRANANSERKNGIISWWKMACRSLTDLTKWPTFFSRPADSPSSQVHTRTSVWQRPHSAFRRAWLLVVSWVFYFLKNFKKISVLPVRTHPPALLARRFHVSLFHTHTHRGDFFTFAADSFHDNYSGSARRFYFLLRSPIINGSDGRR